MGKKANRRERDRLNHPGHALTLTLPQTDIVSIAKIESKVNRIGSIRNRIACSLREAMDVESFIMEYENG